ncbi:MAG: FUSC family protein [Verrucomicrobiota bacterium]
MPFKQLKPFFEWKSPGVSWHIPFLAAVSVGIPLVAGLWSHQPRLGMLAATGAMVILYLPRTPMPVSAKIRRLMACSCGFAICYAIGAGSAFHPAVSALVLGLITVLATTVCRTNKIPPPGSFFFILIATIACCSSFEPRMIPLRAGLVALGGMTSCLVALVYCLLARETRPMEEAGKKDTRLAAILVESSVIGFSVTLSLIVARLLKLDNPYWVPISAAAILQGGTFRAVWHRQVHRIVGTAIGMVLSWFLFPAVPEPVTMAAVIVVLVFVAEYLVPRHYGVAVIFITPMTVAFVEFSAGVVPVHGLLMARLLDIVIGSVIGAAGGWVLHHPQWCLSVEQRIMRLRWFAGNGEKRSPLDRR